MAVVEGYEVFKLLLTVSVLSCLCFGWEVQVPESVTAVEAICVVLPCNTSSHSHVVWYKYGRTLSSVVYSRNSKEITDEFKGRTSVPGNPEQGDCSLRIDRVRPADNEIKLFPWIYPDTGNKYHYITIKVVKPMNPDISMESPQVEGTLFSINCTVRHSCPSSPPLIEWFGLSPVSNNVTTSMDQDRLLWTSVAQAQFKPHRQDYGKKLKCESVFRREHLSSKVLRLNVLYSPTNMKIGGIERNVVEGASISLTCTSSSNPPPSDYQWLVTEKGSTRKHNATRVYSLRHVKRDTLVSCTAQNPIGRGQSEPILLNVHFPPTILLDSVCSDWDGGMRCVCRAEAEPRASISWMVNGSSVLFPFFNTSANYTGRMTLSELTGPLMPNVSCGASNYLGKSTQQIPTQRPLSGRTTLTIVAVVVFIMLVIVVMVICWRMRSHTESSGDSNKQMKTDDLNLQKCAYVNETVEVDLCSNTPQTKTDEGCSANET